MSIILDTGVFFRPDALRRLAEIEERVVVPAVAYAERLRHLAKRGQTQSAFDAFLAQMHFVVEAFDCEEAARYVPRLADDADWLALARDSMIAGHVRPGDELWTTNRRDFARIGVPADQIVALA